MLRKFFSVALLCTLSTLTLKAQSDSTSSKPIFTGSIDAYYRFNFNNPVPDGGSVISHVNNYTSFTNSQNSFELGMASLKAEHSIGKVSGTIDLGFGKRAEEFSYADPSNSTLFVVKQAYISFAASDNVKLTMGKWATHIGYELVDAYLNRNYSMSYMFSYGPFSHTGIKADIGLGGKSSLMLGIANPTDAVSTISPRKFALAQFSTASSDEKVKAYLNYQGSFGGAYSLNQVDLVLTAALADKFSIGYNGTVQAVKPQGETTNSWYGSALYLNLDPTPAFGITLRGEYFNNKKEIVAAPATNIFDLTLSPNIKVQNLTIIPELRFETAGDKIYYKSNNTLTKSTASFILGATYSF